MWNFYSRMSLLRFLPLLAVLLSLRVASAAEPEVDYETQVAPVLRKYCSGCHNDSDREGEFSLESFASLQKGIEDKPAVLPGDSAGSRLWRVVSKQDEPTMPPEDEPAPSAAELALIKSWIDQGAKGPAGAEPDRLTMHVPHIESRTRREPITALAFSPQANRLVLARYAKVEVLEHNGPPEADSPANWKAIRVLDDFPGKVEAAHFNREGTQLLTASGVAGSGGIATLWELATGKRLRDFKGHRDIIFDAELSPDGKLIATSSYDRDIRLWEAGTGKMLRTLSGHNGAVYDIAFSKDGSVLASASADDTCKLWRVSDGERLDTLGQPLKEQYAISFSPDDKWIVAAGADNRIRVWEFVSRKSPKINPLVIARFAHEAPILRMAFTPDGSRLVTTAEDRTIKVWETKNYTELQLLTNQSDVPAALAISPEGDRLVVGRMDGNWELRNLPVAASSDTSDAEIRRLAIVDPQPVKTIPTEQEHEPNNTPRQAQEMPAPGTIEGVIRSEKGGSDQDCFRFKARAGEEWVIEVNAARSKSQLDSFVEVLTSDGQPIEQTLLQAVRDSYFTFRGKNGTQVDDFRIFNWEEMSVNQLLYSSGEVIKLWRMPRGPDSGFEVYPGTGQRWSYFGTTAVSHALGEPCYIVEPHPPGTELIPNGLPTFHVYYENDDASHRELGKDSKLYFVAPKEGTYIVRVRDVRNQQGEKFTYRLMVRPRRPDFSVALAERKPQLGRGSATELTFKVERSDQYLGPIEIQAQGLPPGFTCSTPVIIEPEQVFATVVLAAAADAPEPTPEQVKAVKFTASATIKGEMLSHGIAAFEEIKLTPEPLFGLAITSADGGTQPVNAGGKGPLEFVIHPGETIMLKVVADRGKFSGVIEFGRAESGRNLPHGVYIDNIGLNGLMMLADQSEREFFVTASDWVPEQVRMFHLQAKAKNGPATLPVVLRVERSEQNVAEIKK
jgi:dipeptidyl aminopeptidase/acylaminoacyl peptidase